MSDPTLPPKTLWYVWTKQSKRNSAAIGEWSSASQAGGPCQSQELPLLRMVFNVISKGRLPSNQELTSPQLLTQNPGVPQDLPLGCSSSLLSYLLIGPRSAFQVAPAGISITSERLWEGYSYWKQRTNKQKIPTENTNKKPPQTTTKKPALRFFWTQGILMPWWRASLYSVIRELGKRGRAGIIPAG